jgi:hypothetical protein
MGGVRNWPGPLNNGEGKMTSDNMHGDVLDLHKATGAARLSELQQMFRLGNKMALHDALMECQRLNLPLPDWAVEPIRSAFVVQWKPRRSKWKADRSKLTKRESKLLKGGYCATLARYVRGEVYRSVVAWIKDSYRYVDMPTACIRAWFDGEWKKKPSGEAEAIEFALVGLKDTFAECSETTL